MRQEGKQRKTERNALYLPQGSIRRHAASSPATQHRPEEGGPCIYTKEMPGVTVFRGCIVASMYHRFSCGYATWVSTATTAGGGTASKEDGARELTHLLRTARLAFGVS